MAAVAKEEEEGMFVRSSRRKGEKRRKREHGAC